MAIPRKHPDLKPLSKTDKKSIFNRALMGGRGSGRGPSQSLLVAKAHEILKESESLIMKVIKGEMPDIPAKLRVIVALEIYKRRIPILSEEKKNPAGTGNLTLIKVIKNHIPVNPKTGLPVVTMSQQRLNDEALETVKAELTDEEE